MCNFVCVGMCEGYLRVYYVSSVLVHFVCGCQCGMCVYIGCICWVCVFICACVCVCLTMAASASCAFLMKWSRALRSQMGHRGEGSPGLVHSNTISSTVNSPERQRGIERERERRRETE